MRRMRTRFILLVVIAVLLPCAFPMVAGTVDNTIVPGTAASSIEATPTNPLPPTPQPENLPLKSYTIKYYDGTTLLKSATAPSGSSLNKGSYAPTKTGRSFIGWYTAASGGMLVETVTKNQSVYARYQARLYNVTYRTNTGALIETVSTKYNTALAAGPPKTGYTFLGWYTAKSGGTKVTKVPAKHLTVYARYQIKQYTTKYFVGSTLYKQVKANYNTAVIAGPKKTGYTFAGWYTAKTGGEKITKATQNRTLYARYTVKQYTVKYYHGSTLLLTDTANYNTALRRDIVPEKSGYTFRGWFTAKSGGTKISKLTGNMTVYLRYKIIAHDECQRGTKGLTKLESSLKTRIASYPGTYSIYVKNLDTNEYCMINNRLMYPASLIKLYGMACTYEYFEEGRITKTTQIGTWLENSIVISSNDSYNLLLQSIGSGNTYLGIDRLNTYCQKQGYTQTAAHGSLWPTYLPVYQKGVASTSVKDTAHILEDMYRGTLVSKAASAEMLSRLKRQQRTWKIPAGVPGGVTVANKTGEVAGMEHDAAIVYGKKATYLIVVMSSGDGAAISHIRNLSSVTYTYFNK